MQRQSFLTLKHILIVALVGFVSFEIFYFLATDNKNKLEKSTWATPAEQTKRWHFLNLKQTPDPEAWLKEAKHLKQCYKDFISLAPAPPKLIQSDLLEKNCELKSEFKELQERVRICNEIRHHNFTLKTTPPTQKTELEDNLANLRKFLSAGKD